MARALAYKLIFDSEVYKHNHLLEIWEEGYSGPVTTLRMGGAGFVSKRDRDGGIYGTSMELKLESTLDSQLIKLYTADAQKFLVRHYRNNILVQSGLVVPEQYSEEYIAPPYDISLLVTDGLGLLKEKKYNYFGRHSVLEVLKYCLDTTGLELDFDLVFDMREGLSNPDRSLLEQITIDGEKWRDMTIYEALNELSVTFRAFITQYNGRWRFARYADLMTDSIIYTNNLVYQATLPNLAPKLGNISSVLFPIGSLTFSIDPAYKSVQFTRIYNQKKSWFHNPDFVLLDKWDVATTAQTVIFRDKNYVQLRSLYVGEQVSQTIPVEQSVREFLFQLSYFRIAYTPTEFYVKIKLVSNTNTIYWLSQSGWQSAEASFKFVANEVQDIDSVFSTSPDLKKYQSLQQTGSIQFKDIPATGLLTLYIIAKGPQSVGTDESRRSRFCITDAMLTTDVEKGLTVDAIMNAGNIAAPTIEIPFGDSDVGDNSINILSNYFLRLDGNYTSAWKVGSAGTADSFFNTMVRDYVASLGLPKRTLSGTVMGADLEETFCFMDKFSDTYMYIDTMSMNVYSDEAEITAFEVIPHLELLAVNQDATPETMPIVTVYFETLPDGTRVKKYSVQASGTTYRRVSSRTDTELTLDEILRLRSVANFSGALASLAEKKSESANIAALAAAQTSADVLFRLNNIVSNSVVSIEEKSALRQLIERLTVEVDLYSQNNNNKGADVAVLANAFDDLVYFLTQTVKIYITDTPTELTVEEIAEYNTLFAALYSKITLTGTDISKIKAELLDYQARLAKIVEEANAVVQDYEALVADYSISAAASSNLVTAKTSYISAYNDLHVALTNALADGIISAAERIAISSYETVYSTRMLQFNAAEQNARLAISTNLKASVENLDVYVDGAFRDGVISAAEARAIEKYINTVNATRETILASYTKLYANEYLTGAAKTNLLNAKITLFGSIDTLLSSINSAIADGQTTSSEKADVDSKFASYRSALTTYSTRVEEANKSIQDAIKAFSDAYNYLQQAMSGSTDIQGGLLLTTVMLLRGLDSVVRAGMSGLQGDKVFLFADDTGGYEKAQQGRSMFLLNRDGTANLSLLRIGKNSIGIFEKIYDAYGNFDRYGREVVRFQGTPIPPLSDLVTIVNVNTSYGPYNASATSNQSGNFGYGAVVNITGVQNFTLSIAGNISAEGYNYSSPYFICAASVSIELYKYVNGAYSLEQIIDQISSQQEAEGLSYVTKTINTSFTLPAGQYAIKASYQIFSTGDLAVVNVGTLIVQARGAAANQQVIFGTNGFARILDGNNYTYITDSAIAMKGLSTSPGAIGSGILYNENGILKIS